MATLSNNDIARSIYLLSKDKTAPERSVLNEKVVKFLFRKRLLSKSGEILSHLTKIINKEAGVLVAKVSSVEALDHKMKIYLEQFLKKTYSAKEVTLLEILDKKLLGGLRLEVNDEVMDLSVKNKVKKLQEHLTRDIA
ncbi:MAG: F0F1 ATP synthase subunit delta [Candidatus Parcubacteria bacterium]|nr:F0F1 ATP synthase subunit delta [Candidatus Parcubacteria bacterium]